MGHGNSAAAAIVVWAYATVFFGNASRKAVRGRLLGSAAPMMRPFFGFYGGKWRDAPKYYPAPEHDTIVEAFAGSAGYSVRYADRKIMLGEKDGVIFGVGDVPPNVEKCEIGIV